MGTVLFFAAAKIEPSPFSFFMEKNPILLYAMRLLAMRMHSERELTRKLFTKNFPARKIYELIEKLKAQKLIDDQRFTSQYVDELRNKALGDIRIRFELKKRGIKEKTSEEFFHRETRQAQEQRAFGLARLKLKNNGKIEPREKKRVYDFLVRKGFDYEVCRGVIGRLASGREEEVWES